MSDKQTVVFGFTETQEALTFAFNLATGVDNSLEDGEFTISDLPNFFPALFSAAKAIEGADQIPAEFKLATQEEVDQLKAWINENFDISDDKMEQFIEDTLAIVLDILQVLKKYVWKTEGNPTTNSKVNLDPVPNDSSPEDAPKS